jgi:hypothetical protein
VKVGEPGIGHDGLLARHADRLAVDLDDVAARDEQPDSLRAS